MSDDPPPVADVFDWIAQVCSGMARRIPCTRDEYIVGLGTIIEQLRRDRQAAVAERTAEIDV